MHSNIYPPQPKDDLLHQLRPLIAVEERLNQLRRHYEQRDDVRKVFTFAYELITRELIRAIYVKMIRNTGPCYFRDVGWVIRLNQAFAMTYFEAVQAYDSGGGIFTGGSGHQSSDSWWWQKVFAEIGVAERKNSSVLEALVYPMMAHIVGDLPYALLEIGFDQTHLQDYHRLNDLIADAIDQVQQRVSCRYAQRQLIADRLLGRYDEILSAYGIRLARSLAWYNALRLAEEYRQMHPTNGQNLPQQTASTRIAHHYVDDSSAVQRAIREYISQFVEFHLSSHLLVRLCFQLARCTADESST